MKMSDLLVVQRLETLTDSDIADLEISFRIRENGIEPAVNKIVDGVRSNVDLLPEEISELLQFETGPLLQDDIRRDALIGMLRVALSANAELFCYLLDLRADGIDIGSTDAMVMEAETTLEKAGAVLGVSRENISSWEKALPCKVPGNPDASGIPGIPDVPSISDSIQSLIINAASPVAFGMDAASPVAPGTGSAPHLRLVTDDET